MAADLATRQGLRRRCFDRAMSASCGKASPANSVRQGSCGGGRARRQSRWPGARFCGGSASGAGMAADLAMRRVAARIAPPLFRPGDERSLREGQSCEQRPAGQPRRSGAPAEAMAGRGRIFAAGLLQARDWPQPWQCGVLRQGLRRRCFDRAMNASCGKTSPANSVRQDGRGGRARRQSRWPGGGAFLRRVCFRRGNGRRLGNAAHRGKDCAVAVSTGR